MPQGAPGCPRGTLRAPWGLGQRAPARALLPLPCPSTKWRGGRVEGKLRRRRLARQGAGCKQAPAFAPRTPQHPSSSPVLLPAPTSLPMSSLLLLVSSPPHLSRFSLHSSISGVERVRSSLRIYGRILRRGEAWLPESILRLAPGREWLHAPPPPGISFTPSPSIRPAAPPICPSPPTVLTTLTLHRVPVADVDTSNGHKTTTVLFPPNWNLSNWITATNWCFSTSLTQRSVFARKRKSVDTNGRIGKTSLSQPTTTSRPPRDNVTQLSLFGRCASLAFLGRSLHAQLSETSSLFLRP